MTDALGPLIATGNVAEVYAYGEDVLKLYKPGLGPERAAREAEIMAWLESTGLPVPRLRRRLDYDGRFGLVMGRAPGTTFANSMKAAADPSDWIGALASLHRRIHAVGGSGLLPLKQRLRDHIGRAEELDDARRQSLLEGMDRLPGGDRLCHGDFHPFNVLGTPGDATIIDWLDASCGDPAADLCRTYVLLGPWAPEIAEAHIEAYGIDRERVFEWLPFVAAARLAENIDTKDQAFLLELLDRGGWR